MVEESRHVYKDQVYGYDLGRFLLEVARAVAEVHPMLPRIEYEVKLSRARSMLASLLAVIPRDVHGGNPLALMDRVEGMDVRELRATLFEVTEMLDRKRLLIPKKTERRAVGNDVEL